VAVRRNDARFPGDFLFTVTQDEFGRLGQSGRVSFVLTVPLERLMSISIAEVDDDRFYSSACSG
jgi:hypothetical protein